MNGDAHGTALDRVLDALDRAGRLYQETRPGDLMAQCPAHDDRDPSLHITDNDGHLLLHCFAGCECDDVLAALGLVPADLFDNRRDVSYRYADRNGMPNRIVTRTIDKRFRQSGRRDKVILYRLPEVIKAVAAGRTVHLVEGEKDVHAIEHAGGTATTAPQGASNFGLVDVTPLQGATVVAVVDRDQAGAKWAECVRERLFGIAASVTFVQARTGKDAADHLLAGHTLADFEPLGPDREPADGAKFGADVLTELHKLKVRRAARERLDAELLPPAPPFDAATIDEILARPAEPTARVDQLIPWAAATLVVAQRKTGKTTTVLDLTRCLITGDKFLNSFEVTPISGNVAILNYEVSAAQLAGWAHRTDLADQAHRLLLVNLRGRRNPLRHAGDRDQLARRLRDHSTETLIVDPFSRAFTGDNQNDAGQVSSFLSDLDQFTRTEVGALDLIVTAHAGWGAERSRGSSALEDFPDSLIYLNADTDTGQRYIRAIGRDIDLPEAELELDGHRLRLSGGGSRKQAKTEAKWREQEQTVLDVLGEQTEPILTGQLETLARQRPGIGFQRGDTGAACRRLEQRGLVIHQPAPRGGSLWTRAVTTR